MRSFLTEDLLVGVISLPERQKYGEGVVTFLKNFGLPAELFPGVLVTRDEVKPEWYNHFWNWKWHKLQEDKYICGSVGCKLAHLSLVKAAKDRGKKRVLVVEDDAIIDPALFEKFWAFYEAAFFHRSSWDIVYLGGLFTDIPRGLVPEGVYPATNLVCALAYVLNSRCFDLVLDRALVSGQEIDLFYMDRFQKGLKSAFAVLPFSVKADLSFPSGIRAYE